MPSRGFTRASAEDLTALDRARRDEQRGRHFAAGALGPRRGARVSRDAAAANGTVGAANQLD